MRVESEDLALLNAMHAHSGIVCAVGAGGKKTTLYRLLAAHSGRVGLSATSFTYTFPDDLPAEVHVAELETLLSAVPASSARRVAYARPSDKKGRLGGLDAADILTIHRSGRFDLTLLKADGARMRRIKCPGDHEPTIPACADTVLMVQSAAALGRTLDERVAHRPECVSAVTGLALGKTIQPNHLGRIFSHPEGLLKDTHTFRVIPVLHMVDTPELEAQAREVAIHALAASHRFDHVVLTSARRDIYLVDIVRR